MNASMHVDEECLEDYARRDCTSGVSFADVQAHVAHCGVCQERLLEIYEYVSFLKAAPSETEGRLMRRHDTKSGTVFLAVTGSDADGWEAHALGSGVHVTRDFFRGSRAKAFLEEWFAMEHAGHSCTRGCSGGWK